MNRFEIGSKVHDITLCRRVPSFNAVVKNELPVNAGDGPVRRAIGKH